MMNKRKKLIRLIVIGLALMLNSYIAYGEIIYDKGSNKILIVEYSQNLPCTLKMIRQANDKNNWGVVTYDSTKDTTRINADIDIGSDAGVVGTNTYLQIGTGEHSRETLVLAGNIHIKLTKPGYTNQLQLGYPDKPNINPVLKFACSRKGEYSIFSEYNHRTKTCFKAYNSVITALTQDKEHMVGQPKLYGDIEIINSNLSWISSRMCYGIGKNDRIESVTFSHGGTGIYGGEAKAKGCTFTNLQTAIEDSGSIDAELYDCVFKDNNQNVNMRYGGHKVVLIDCDIQKAKYNNALRRYKRKDGTLSDPRIVVKRSLVVEVVDKHGNPIENALVDVVNEVKGGPVPENGASITDEDGLTSLNGSDREILLVDYIEKAGGTKSFAYKVKITVDGKIKEIKGVDPDNSWYGKKVTLTVTMDIEAII